MIQFYGIDAGKTVLTFDGDPHAPDVQEAVTALVANSGGKIGTASPFSLGLVAAATAAVIGLGFVLGKVT